MDAAPPLFPDAVVCLQWGSPPLQGLMPQLSDIVFEFGDRQGDEFNSRLEPLQLLPIISVCQPRQRWEVCTWITNPSHLSGNLTKTYMHPGRAPAAAPFPDTMVFRVRSWKRGALGSDPERRMFRAPISDPRVEQVQLRSIDSEQEIRLRPPMRG